MPTRMVSKKDLGVGMEEENLLSVGVTQEPGSDTPLEVKNLGGGLKHFWNFHPYLGK